MCPAKISVKLSFLCCKPSVGILTGLYTVCIRGISFLYKDSLGAGDLVTGRQICLPEIIYVFKEESPIYILDLHSRIASVDIVIIIK